MSFDLQVVSCDNREDSVGGGAGGGRPTAPGIRSFFSVSSSRVRPVGLMRLPESVEIAGQSCGLYTVQQQKLQPYRSLREVGDMLLG